MYSRLEVGLGPLTYLGLTVPLGSLQWLWECMCKWLQDCVTTGLMIIGNVNLQTRLLVEQ